MTIASDTSPAVHDDRDDAPTGRFQPLGVRERARATGPFPRPVPGRHLAIESGGEVLLVRLDRDVLHIGRSPSADIVIDAPTVSRRHAVIARQDGETVVLDDRSRHGVIVNGEPVGRAVLRSGDVIGLGAVTLRYVVVND